MKTNKIDAFLTGIPAWALAALAMVIITFIMFALPDGWVENKTAEAIFYVVMGIINAFICYLIVRKFPKSLWYVPVIINAMYIVSVFAENYGLRDWLFIGGMWVLSIIASLIGAWHGSRTVNRRKVPD